MLRNIRFTGSIAILYLFTLGTIANLVQSSLLFGTNVQADTKIRIAEYKTVKIKPQTTSGKPVRISIDGTTINVPIEDGVYNKSNGGWTLSDTTASFATMTAPANNQQGTTFIYGHGTDAVFGQIVTHRPAEGTAAYVYTDNGYRFTYKLTSIQDLNPNDTWILDDTANSKPRLMVQTCTGAFSQWRTIYTFAYDEVQSWN